MNEETKVIVIGGGSSGLATAAELRRRGVPAVVLERSSAVGAAWARRYDRLRLNSGRPFSRLPRGRHAKGTPIFPLRDDIVRYLGAYAERHRVDVRTHVRVDRIDRTLQGWVVCTSDGDFEAEHVVVATGYDHTGLLPDWPGRADYTRPLVHAAEYRNPEPYRDRDVLVVGPGCTGAEVAYDLATGGASRVRLAVRTPPNILIRTPIGVLLARTFMKLPPERADAILRKVRIKEIGDLTEHGLPIPEEGVFSRLRRLGVAPMIVDKEVIDAIKERRIEIVAGVESFDEHTVGLADGTRIEPDAVIAATGYRCGLEDMVGHLGVLNERGVPTAHAEAPAARGLRFVGFVPIPGHFAYGGAQARQAAKAIAHELRGRAPRPAAAPAPPVTAGCA
jgi:cation diffusion facilitator CzcD-associated flavoprotein CzcO